MLLEAAHCRRRPRPTNLCPMRVGVVILPQFSWPEARARWKSLEDRGFAHGWTYDHLAWRDLAEQTWFGTIPTLTAAATATSHAAAGHLGHLPQLPAPGDAGQGPDDAGRHLRRARHRRGRRRRDRLGRNRSGPAAADPGAARRAARRVRHAARSVADPAGHQLARRVLPRRAGQDDPGRQPRPDPAGRRRQRPEDDADRRPRRRLGHHRAGVHRRQHRAVVGERRRSGRTLRGDRRGRPAGTRPSWAGI